MNTRQQDVDQSVWWVLTLPVRKGVIDRALRQGSVDLRVESTGAQALTAHPIEGAGAYRYWLTPCSSDIAE
jgi:hypothetical protein